MGKNDVNDCIDLINLACNQYSFIDENSLTVYGASHGGFLSAHLIQHPLIC